MAWRRKTSKQVFAVTPMVRAIGDFESLSVYIPLSRIVCATLSEKIDDQSNVLTLILEGTPKPISVYYDDAASSLLAAFLGQS